MKLKIPLFLVGLTIAFGLINSCSPSQAEVPAAGYSAKNYSGESDQLSFNAVANSPAVLKEESSPGNSNQVPEAVRKKVMRANVSLEVQDLAKGLATIAKDAESLGGYVSESTNNRYQATITIRVPANQYQAVFVRTQALGSVLSATSNTDDVTDQFYDLSSRIATKRILLERYLSYLKQANKIEDLLAIEATVNQLTWEIESIEANLKGLNNQIDYSTITVNLSLAGKVVDTTWDFGTALGDLGKDAAGFFRGLLMVVLYLIVIGIPLLALGLLAWLILFGKIGLLRKAFGLVRNRKLPNKVESSK